VHGPTPSFRSARGRVLDGDRVSRYRVAADAPSTFRDAFRNSLGCRCGAGCRRVPFRRSAGLHSKRLVERRASRHSRTAARVRLG
jgi:hypothetical protein